MADIHCLPLMERDMPTGTSFDEPEVRASVFPRRNATGVQEWYYRLKVQYVRDGEWCPSIILHGPYLTARDANKAAEDEIEML